MNSTKRHATRTPIKRMPPIKRRMAPTKRMAYVRATYYRDLVYKIPKNIEDINDTSVVEEWYIRTNTLIIKLVGNPEIIQIKATYDDYVDYGPSFEDENDLRSWPAEDFDPELMTKEQTGNDGYLDNDSYEDSSDEVSSSSDDDSDSD